MIFQKECLKIVHGYPYLHVSLNMYMTRCCIQTIVGTTPCTS